MPKDHVVSFRLDDKSFKALNDRLMKAPPANVNSTNQLARKIVDDVLAGRLNYKNPVHARKDMTSLD